MKVEVRASTFDPWCLLQALEDEQQQLRGRFGATCTFIGTMRDYNEGDEVRGMRLEHYPGMTEKHLQRICEEATARWDLLDVLLVHRVGDLSPGEPIVLVAVWTPHRKDAFEACRHIMEELKSKAPFWKKEKLEHGSRWVEKNTSGY